MAFINGSLLSGFSRLELSTADDKHYTLEMTPFSKLAFRVIGLPHLGFRMRARIILGHALKASKQSKVLDAGCGYGLYSLSLAQEGFNAIDAVDIDAGRIATLERMFTEQPNLASKINLKVGSLTALPFEDNSYDMIICSEVVEHIKDDTAAVRELSRVLKPGGKLIFSVPHDSTINQKTYGRFAHERPGYTKEKLVTMFGQHGVVLTSTTYYEYRPGNSLFNGFNAINSKPLLGVLFYPFYILYILDQLFKIGEPNFIVITATKN